METPATIFQLRCPTCGVQVQVDRRWNAALVNCPACRNAIDVAATSATQGVDAPQEPWLTPERRYLLLRFGIGFLAIAACLSVVLLLGVVSGIVRLPWLQDPVNEIPDSPDGLANDPPPDATTKIQWHGPDKILSIDGMQVGIKRVEFDAVRGKNERGLVVVTPKPYLQVWLTIKNGRRERVNYRSWYSERGELDAAEDEAVLYDAEEHPYYPSRFADANAVRGHTAATAINPNREINDVLVFSLPEGFNERSTRYLRLELPGSAVDARSAFRFEFPIGLVDFAGNVVAPPESTATPPVQ